MTAEGHLIFSVACAIFAKKAEVTPELATGDWWHIIPAALLTSLLPDIDHPKSVLGQRLRWIALPIAVPLAFSPAPAQLAKRQPAGARTVSVPGGVCHLLARRFHPAGAILCRANQKYQTLITKIRPIHHLDVYKTNKNTQKAISNSIWI